MEIEPREREEHGAVRRLWCEVFRLGVLDLQGRGWQTSAKTRQLRREQAAAWMHSARRDAGSFKWLCGVFDLDAGRVRATVLPQPRTRCARRAAKR